MPPLAIPESGLSLGSSAKSDFAYPDMFGLTLSDSVIEDMIKAVRSGNGLQLSLGNDPKITYGSQNLHLSSLEDTFPCEYFRTALTTSSTSKTSSLHSQTSDDMASKTNPLRQTNLWGKSSKKFVPRIRLEGGSRAVKNVETAVATASKVKAPQVSPTAGSDAALAALKSSLASEDAKKKDNTTRYVKDNSALPPAVQQKGHAQPIKAGNKARFLAQHKSLGGGATRSMPTSPSLTGVGSPALAPTSVPLSQQQAEKTKAICRPIVHMLALGPKNEDTVHNAKKPDISEQEFKLALEKVASLVDGQWLLKQKSFKELDVWSYKKYTPEQRQIAIDNAIRAFDKMRLNLSEPEWERLHPFEERGTGKVLSKLQAKIATGAIKATKGPKIRIQGAEDSGRDTAAEDDEDLFGEKLSTPTIKGGEPMARSHSNPPATKAKKVSEKEAQAKRLLAKPGKSKPASTKTEKKSAEKESTRIKSSKFVSESDEEDDSYLISNNKPATTAQAKHNSSKNNTTRPAPSKPAVKRARDDSEDMASKPKVAKTLKGNNTSPQKSSPLASSPPTNASDFEDSSSSNQRERPLKRKPADISTSAPPSKLQKHKHSSSASTSSSVASSSSINSASSGGSDIKNNSIGGINGVRAFDWDDARHATKKHTSINAFKLYYSKYKELHDRLVKMKPRDREASDAINDLVEMRERLSQMKGEILSEARESGLI